MVGISGLFIDGLNGLMPIIYNIIYTVVALVGAYIIKRLVTDRIIYSFARRAGLSKATAKPVKKFMGVLVYIGALFVILGIWNLKDLLLGMLAGAGVAGIVIGFAAKDVFSDILAGVMLFFDRPFKIGEAVNIGDVSGKVTDIGLRSTKIKTWDSIRVTIPNSKVESEVVTNYSHYDQRRLEIEVGVDYDTDIKKAVKTIEKTLKKKKLGILKEPGPQVLVKNFGGSSIDLEVRFWVGKEGPHSIPGYKSAVREEINKAFKKEKIEIPFQHVEILQKDK